MKTYLFYLVLCIFLSSKIYSQGGDNAAAAAASPITLPFSASGTTCGKVNNYNPLSLYGITPDGRDWLYYFCATTTGTVDISLTSQYGYMPAVLVYSTTPNAAGTNWYASSLGNYINSLVTITVTAGSCYYVMVDNDPLDNDYGDDCFPYTININYHTNPPASPLQAGCTNMGYDLGNLSGWSATTGAITIGAAGAATPVYTPIYYTSSATQHSVTSGAGVDPYGGFPIVNPGGGPNSVRLGDMGTFGTLGEYFGGVPGATGATLEQKFQVTASNALFVYYYAVVIQDAGTDHTNQEQPFFKTDVFDCSGNPVACGQYLVVGGPGIPGFIASPAGGNVYYKTWTPVAVDLTPYIGTCVTVRYTVGDCTRGAHFCYAYIDASCGPLAVTGVNQICPDKSTVLTAPTGLFTYSWTPGGQTTQSITVTPTVATTYSVELTSYTNCKTNLTYSVSLFPQAVASANSQTICSGTSALITPTVNGTGGTYSWSPGGGSGSTNSPSPTSTTIYTLTYTNTDGCQDTALSRITVNPLPTMSVPPSTTICHNTNITASAFTSTVAGTTYAWSNSNTGIGLTASGIGNVPAFTAVNTGASPVSAIISVTPTANTCVGTPITYTITVNPIPNVSAVPGATYCSGIAVPAAALSGSVASTTFNWSNTNTAIGLAGSGVGNVSGFTASNTGASGINGVITVTPSANSCTGTPMSYTVTVNPIPNVTSVPSATYCSGASVPATALSGSVTGTSFNWINTNTSVGLTGSGSNTVPSFIAANTGASPINGVVTVTPSANSCTGTPMSYTITTNPIPNVNSVPSATYCNGVAVAATALTGSVTSTAFDWSNTNTAIGLVGSGTGNVSGFTASNTGASGINGIITVTPSANSCTGTPVSYTITVNPTPTVTVPAGGSFCAGDVVPSYSFTSNVAGAAFNWANNNTTIGLAASGAGNINSFTSSNTGASPINGVVTVTPSANGCTGTPSSFTITVNPKPAAPTVQSTTVCPGSVATLTATAPGGTYTWYDAAVAGNVIGTGSVYTTPGLTTTTSYYVNAVNAYGCPGPNAVVTVTVLNVLAVTASPNQTICAGASATLNVSPNGAGYVYSWSSAGSPNFSTNQNPTVTPANTTNYTVAVTSPQGCTGTAQTQVQVNPIPVANTGSSIAFCNGQSGSIGSAAQVGYSYAWSPGTGLTSTTSANPGVSIANTGNTPAVYNYTLSVTLNGCSSNGTVDVTVNPSPVSDAGAPLTLCTGQTGTIGGVTTTGYNYFWLPAANLSSSTVANPVVTGNNPGVVAQSANYTVTTTDAATSCQSSATVMVTVLPAPMVNAGSVATTCQGTSSLQLNGNFSGSVGSVLWSGGAGSFSNNSIVNPVYTPAASEYSAGVTLTLTAIATAPCQNVSSPVTVSFYPNPVITFSVDNPKGCPVHCVNFTDHTTAGGDAIVGWDWSFGDGKGSTAQNPAHCYDLSGFYDVTLMATSVHNCTATLTYTQMIEVYPQPIAAFSADPMVTTILESNVSFYNASQDATTYSWNFGDSHTSGSSNTSALTNPTHEYVAAGEYTVGLVATSSHGCVDRTSLVIKVEPEFTFYIPNAYTPGNSDNLNDTFGGVGIGIIEYELWVFDRWGENIFYSNDINSGWNGKKHGQGNIVQQDVYVWKVKLKDVFGRPHEYIGHVTLVK